ncbi:MAG: tRNA lysidine(34) synthetase TilS C-terminal domain-containing protein [Trichloromonadaceae bacterium]
MESQGTILRELIDKAIQDERVTAREYDRIMEQANADGIIDAEERVLLATLQAMIADGSVKRVKE